MNTAVLISGEGSNLAAIRHARIPIALTLADRRCTALRSARRMGLSSELVERTDFTKAFDAERAAFTTRVVRTLVMYNIELVVMAGFMTLLSPEFFKHYPGRVLNIHPSLLPKFKGKDAVQQTLDAKETMTGSTVHLATEETDDHRHILAQSQVGVHPHDTVETLTRRLKRAEAHLYPRAIEDYRRKLSKK